MGHIARPKYALDIETDTSGGGGLDPRTSRILSVAVVGSCGTSFVLDDSDEERLLSTLDMWLILSPAGTLTTWNGAAFDLPFIEERARQLGTRIGLVCVDDPARTPKYAPQGPRPGCVTATWYDHDHDDVAYTWQQYAADHDVPWSLKPVARHRGLDPVEEDREKISELSSAQRCAYNLSDAETTLQLALQQPPQT